MLKTVSLFIAIVASAGILSGQAIAAEWALGAALPQHLQQSEPPPAKQCQPSIWGLLLSAGWAYATKSPIPTHEPRPCPDNLQEVRKRAQAQEARDAPAGRLANLPAGEALRQVRLLFIRPRSSWFNPEKLERELLKRKEFGELGLEITRKLNSAEAILEITRKTFTTRFTCSIIEPTTARVLAAVTASSLGGEIEPHLAEAIIKQFKAARSKPATEEKVPE